jgi:mRNA interferase HigB
MRLIAVSTLNDFWVQPVYKDAEIPLRAWLFEVQKANWKSPTDIKAQFGNASILKNRRVVFNIKGNDYRLVVAVAYVYQAVYIKFVGTHEQYDAINALTVELKP